MLLDDFLHYQAKLPTPYGHGHQACKGSYIIDQNGKKYLDFVAGVSACSLGHRHPAVIRAIKNNSSATFMSWFMGNMRNSLPLNCASYWQVNFQHP